MTVYKHYDQQQLNDQYNNRLHVPDYADYFERWEKLSRQTEKEHAVIKDIFFGNHAEECLDIFPAKIPLATTIVFIHGGYWHLLDKALFHFLADDFCRHDITTVFINYPLAPASSIDTIVSSCHSAIKWLHNNLVRFNGDPSQLYVMGHSAGAHLAAMLLVEENMHSFKGVVALSGLFSLQPVMLSYINEMVCMDNDTAIKNSPVCLKPVHVCPLLLVTGGDETNEFKDQTLQLYNAWRDKQACMEILSVPGKNHYSILDAVTEKSVLRSAVYQMLGIDA